MPAFKDLTGKRFGRLTVISRAEDYVSPTGKKTARWLCRCDCGKEVTVFRNSLTRGAASCGCIRAEKAKNAAADLAGQRFGAWTVLERVPLPKKTSNGEVNGWLCRCDCGTERVIRTKLLTHGESTSCGCKTAEKAAERIKAEGDNVLGRFDGTVISKLISEKPTKASTTGIRGVYWSEREQLYKVAVTLRGQTIHVGRFSKIEDAKKARDEAVEKYFIPVIEEYENSKDEH